MIQPDERELSRSSAKEWLQGRSIMVVSNRGPVSFSQDDQGDLLFQRSGGGLVTALTGLAEHVEMTWVAAAVNPLETSWQSGQISLGEGAPSINLQLVPLSNEVYEGYYNVIANPLLWFLQHSMWNFISAPTITRATWDAWEQGYVAANREFAAVIAHRLKAEKKHTLVMLQDYHLYLVPRLLRNLLRRRRNYTLTYFVHIPWPGSEDWGFLPAGMRQPILEGLTAVDLLGFQTREDGLNFLRTVETFLPGSHVSYGRGRIAYRNHVTHVRDFPISVDVMAVQRLAISTEVQQLAAQLEKEIDGYPLIVRVDRTEPSKNIVRGFQAFGEMLDLHPEHCGRVKFYALLVPSRLNVEEYQNYHNELTAAAGWINSRHGTSEWEPVRILTGESYPRALAALQQYDVLLVNSIADGMNLVAKEGPLVNRRDGVVVLSERTGARQQLESGALVISPCDVYATAEALHQALTMPAEERALRAARLRRLVEEHDINDWLASQVDALQSLRL
ncbi:MAG: trehalose-6-phosphate synthase [Bellilinea sp.]